MQIALDDVEMRTPFLTEVLEWKRANAVELAGMSWKTTPAEVERHWKMFNGGITPIAQKHFALSKKKERQPWATPELAALSEAKKQALQVFDAHRVRWSSVPRIQLRDWFRLWHLRQHCHETSLVANRRARRDKREHNNKLFGKIV